MTAFRFITTALLSSAVLGWAADPMPARAQGQALPVPTEPAGVPAVTPTGAPKTVTIDAFDGIELTLGSITAQGLTALLTDVLIEDARFAVIEGSPGGARFFIRAVVTRYDPAAGGAGVNVGGFGALGRMAGASAKTRTTTVGISLRMIDASTGQVVATAKATGSASGQEADAGLVSNRDGSTMGANAFRGTSMAKAFEDAMRKAADELARKTAALS